MGSHRRVVRLGLLHAAALAAALAASACGSSADATGRSAITVSVDGRVGTLRVDESRRTAVVAFAGRPDAEQRGRTGRSQRYDALGYGCGASAGPDAIPLVRRTPRCRTVFFILSRTQRLGLFYTADDGYSASEGVRIGMTTSAAERRLGRRVHVGCGPYVFLRSRRATLTISFSGGRIRRDATLAGGHVGAFVLHGLHDDPGVFECM